MSHVLHSDMFVILDELVIEDFIKEYMKKHGLTDRIEMTQELLEEISDKFLTMATFEVKALPPDQDDIARNIVRFDIKIRV